MKLKTNTNHFLPILLVAIVAIGAYAVWRSNTPYSFPTNWDIWEHQTLINVIKGGKWALYPSQLSDTFRFDGYTTLFHTVIAFLQSFTNMNVLGFWWISEGILTVVMGLVSYILTYIMTRSRTTSVVAGMLSSLFFESTVVFAPLFLMPQTAAALLWVIGLTVLLSRLTVNQKMLFICPIILLMVFTHMVIGLVGTMLYGAFLLLHDMTILSKRAVFISSLFVIPIVTYAICTMTVHLFPFDTINYGEAGAYMQNIWGKLTTICSWYGFLPIIFLPIGLLTSKNKPLAVMYTVLMATVFSQIPYALKFYTLGRFLTLAFIASGLSFLISFIKTRWMRWMTILFVILAAGIVFLANSTAWKQTIEFKGIASQVSSDEITAAQFLKNIGTGTASFLVSDPATQYILEALTEINSQGGAYMNESSRNKLVQLFSAETPDEFRHQLFSIKDTINDQIPDTMFLVINSRTFKWLEQPDEKRFSLVFNIWRPDALTFHDRMKIDIWETQYQLIKIYKNESLVIFEIVRPVAKTPSMEFIIADKTSERIDL